MPYNKNSAADETELQELNFISKVVDDDALGLVNKFLSTKDLCSLSRTCQFFKQSCGEEAKQRLMQTIQELSIDASELENILMDIKQSIGSWNFFALKFEKIKAEIDRGSQENLHYALKAAIEKNDVLKFIALLLNCVGKAHFDINQWIREDYQIEEYRETQFKTLLQYAVEHGEGSDLHILKILTKIPSIQVNKGMMGESIVCGGSYRYAETPLMTVVKLGFEDCANLLIEAGADVNAKDYKGISVMGYAKDSQTCQLLLQSTGRLTQDSMRELENFDKLQPSACVML
jgi:hypothetical protein